MEGYQASCQGEGRGEEKDLDMIQPSRKEKEAQVGHPGLAGTGFLCRSGTLVCAWT